MRKDQKLLIFASVAALLLWALPFTRPLALPVVYLNTHLHELCHALAAVATGGTAHLIHVYADGSGIAKISGGAGVIVASAGYVGATLLGAAMIVMAGTERGARTALYGLAALLALALLVWVRADLVGLGAGAVWAGLCFLLARLDSRPAAIFAAQFIGVQQCLASLQSLLVQLDLAAFTEKQSDAEILADGTGVPAIVWAVAWAVIAIVALTVALRAAWNGEGIAGRRR
jgi:hypothetical protein